MSAPLFTKWRKLDSSIGTCPRPRHGHRAVAVRDLMIVFGGGNEGIVEELHVYRSSSNQWFMPTMKGDIPPGCAAYGFTTDGNRIFLFGGMVEYGRYSSDLYELKICNWEWKKLRPRSPKNDELPQARLGHSFTMVGSNKIFLFGGLANDSINPKQNIPKYLDDLYVLEVKPMANGSVYQWEKPHTFGSRPSPRESHTAVSFTPSTGGSTKLLIYGGMSGFRLGDIWILDTESMTWSRPQINGNIPSPRSLHSATVLNQKMYIFGGWVPLVGENDKTGQEKEWKCTNSLAIFNLDSLSWDYISGESIDDSAPRARAGHSAVAISSRLYVWSGRDGYRKAWNNQVCCKDLWILETDKPQAPSRVQLVKATTSTFDVMWGHVSAAEQYIVQIQKIDSPQPPQAVQAIPESEPSAPKKMMLPPATVPPVPVTSPPVPTPLPASAPIVNTVPLAVIATVNPTTMVTSVSTTITTTAATSSHVANPTAATSSMAKVASVPKTQVNVTPTTTGPSEQMSGIAALASVAAATSKISTPTVMKTATLPSNIRVINQQLIPGTSLKLTTTSGSTPHTIRILTSNNSGIGSKQILVKTAGQGGVAGQNPNPQMMTIVKTSQGQMLKMLPTTMTVKTSGANIITSNPTIVAIPSNSSTNDQTNITISTGGDVVNRGGTQNKDTSKGTIMATPTIAKVGNNPVKIVMQHPRTTGASNTANVPNIIRFSPGTVLPSGSKVKFAPTVFRTANPNTSKFVIQNGQYSKLVVSNSPASAGRVLILSTSSQTIPTSPAVVVNSIVTNPIAVTTAAPKPLQSSSNGSNVASTNKIPQVDGADDTVDDISSTSVATIQSTSTITASPNVVPVDNSSNLLIPLSTTSSAMALSSNSSLSDQHQSIAGNADSSTASQPNQTESQNSEQWYDVGIFKTNHCSISEYYAPKDDTTDYDPERNIDLSNVPTYMNYTKVPLEPGTTYRIRVAAINPCGRGPWSDVFTNLKTCIPGYPPAPTSIKITKCAEGAQLSWSISNFDDPIHEYAVYLAIRSSLPTEKQNSMSFFKVYNGASPSCVVSQNFLESAFIDHNNNKAAIIFRIAARNVKGYGPATQVRWLQDLNTSSQTPKAPSKPSPTLTNTRKRPNSAVTE
ncbi:hypothetical protein RDWZM_000685 [Blomia tropicalis]|uniref:Fibronectin type-III domain-containing protein n=1 Tax=Blomia tropicalis TaxID=40697 RepID=A0A9Q0MED0_BLOTA|nr:hypothetical protein RDWZM_000685 [Blomia tropicalis]